LGGHCPMVSGLGECSTVDQGCAFAVNKKHLAAAVEFVDKWNDQYRLLRLKIEIPKKNTPVPSNASVLPLLIVDIYIWPDRCSVSWLRVQGRESLFRLKMRRNSQRLFRSWPLSQLCENSPVSENGILHADKRGTNWYFAAGPPDFSCRDQINNHRTSCTLSGNGATVCAVRRHQNVTSEYTKVQRS